MRVTKNSSDRLDKVAVYMVLKLNGGLKRERGKRNNNVCPSEVLQISCMEAAEPRLQRFNLDLRALRNMLRSLPEP